MTKIVAKVKEYKYYLALISILIFLEILYIAINFFSHGGRNIAISLDNIIPFVPGFSYVYMYWDFALFIGLIFILIKNKKQYIKSILSITIGVSICLIIFIFFQTEFTRPTVVGDGVTMNFIRFIYGHDKPVNCFPSVHVVVIYTIMRYTKISYSRKWFYYTEIVGWLIIVSTLLIKQHFVLDVIGAIVLCEVIIAIVKRIDEKYFNNIVSYLDGLQKEKK